MILTEEKIKVTHDMMVENGMWKYNRYGIPKNINNPYEGLIWKDILQIEESDLDVLEEYFIIKTKTKGGHMR